jgi:NAD(P)H-flavin reductase
MFARVRAGQLYRRSSKGNLKHGKDIGPDGTQLIRVDGPHTAPAQHYGSYHTVMLVGAGIGLTPSAAIIRAILRYKWKKGYKPVRFCSRRAAFVCLTLLH